MRDVQSLAFCDDFYVWDHESVAFHTLFRGSGPPEVMRFATVPESNMMKVSRLTCIC